MWDLIVGLMVLAAVAVGALVAWVMEMPDDPLTREELERMKDRARERLGPKGV